MAWPSMYTKPTVAVSGGFDPLHVGHIRMFQEAAKLGELVVIVNNDDFLIEKKGRVFMPLLERMEIIQAIGCVNSVMASVDNDMTVRASLALLQPDIFANGGDRFSTDIPEREICEKLGIQMVFGVGGGKVQSSSSLCNEYENSKDSVGMVDEITFHKEPMVEDFAR